MRVAINGYAGIGRHMLGVLMEGKNKLADKIDIAAMNDSGGSAINAHFSQHEKLSLQLEAVHAGPACASLHL